MSRKMNFKNVFPRMNGAYPDNKGLRNILIFFVAVVTLFTLFHYVHDVPKMALESKFIDFGHYYFYTTIIRQGYNPFDNDTVQKFEKILDIRYAKAPANYPPFFYLLMRPLSYLSYSSAQISWLILNQFFLLFSLIFCIRIIKDKVSVLEITTIIFLVFNFYPLFLNLKLGQSNLLIFFLLSSAFYLFRKRQDLPAGALLALAMCIKPQMGLIFLFFLLKRKYKIVLSTILAYGLFTAISIVFIGIRQHLDYIQYILHLSSKINLAWTANLSFTGLFYRLFTEGTDTTPLFRSATTAMVLSTLASLIILGVSIFIWKRRTSRDNFRINLEFSLAIVTLLLISPFTEEHHFVLLFLPFIYILHSFLKNEVRYPLMGGVALSYVIVGSEYYLNRFTIFNKGILLFFLMPKVYGVLLLWGILVYILYKEPKQPPTIQQKQFRK